MATCSTSAMRSTAASTAGRWRSIRSPSGTAKTATALPPDASGKRSSSSSIAFSLWLPGATRSSTNEPPIRPASGSTSARAATQAAMVTHGRRALASPIRRVSRFMAAAPGRRLPTGGSCRMGSCGSCRPLDLSAGFVRDGCRPAAPVGARRQRFERFHRGRRRRCRLPPSEGSDAPTRDGEYGPTSPSADGGPPPPQAGDGASELDLRWLARRVAVPAPGNGTLPGQGTGRLSMERR